MIDDTCSLKCELGFAAISVLTDSQRMGSAPGIYQASTSELPSTFRGYPPLGQSVPFGAAINVMGSCKDYQGSTEHHEFNEWYVWRIYYCSCF